MEERPIQDYAPIGDCRSAALISRGGSLDWLCWPRFDSPALFSSLLDPALGGSFRIAPAEPAAAEREYLPDTNVLVTRFRNPRGALELTDFMPALHLRQKLHRPLPEHSLWRIARCTEGEVAVLVHFDPRPRFGTHRFRARSTPLGIRAEWPDGMLLLRSSHPLQLDPAGGARAGGPLASARVVLRPGQSMEFALCFSAREIATVPPLGAWPRELLALTVGFWRGYARRVSYRGPYREQVVRSALALKLLTFAPSGAVTAAPTTSLPETIGGPLNWDYRYCWLRDASLTTRALFGLGFPGEAEAFVSWLLNATSLTRPELRVLYDVYGRAPQKERTLEHLSGHQGSRPVRLGNAAQDQLQLDVYGEVVDAAAHFIREGGAFDRETAAMLCGIGRLVCARWREPDDGIWEARGERNHYTHSRVLCWTALDRLLELQRKGHLPDQHAGLFARECARIHEEVERRGVDRTGRFYVRTLGGEDLDASLLLLPWYGYAKADSPRMRETHARIVAELGLPGGLLRRYRGPFTEGEGAFGICSFWEAEYLALGGGTEEEATRAFERLLGYANDVGLYGEEIAPGSGAALGNFPQAYTHVGLINAALTLESCRVGRIPSPEVSHRKDRPEPSPEARL